MVLPFIAFQIIEIENEVMSYIAMSIPLLTFYLYTNVISYVIGGHLNKVDTLKEMDFESRMRRRYYVQDYFGGFDLTFPTFDLYYQTHNRDACAGFGEEN